MHIDNKAQCKWLWPLGCDFKAELALKKSVGKSFDSLAPKRTDNASKQGLAMS
jgi:hypothetical protein